MPSTGNSHKILSKTMRAAIAQNYKSRLEIVNVPMPHPKSREMLVKIKRCGCCHTDLHALEGDWPVKCKMPLCPGHEGAGIVEAVGGDVTHFKVGDRVGIPWLYSACGTCEYCNSGWETLCLKQQNAGYSVPGGMAEYAIAAESNAILLPPTISFDQVAPILCAGVTAYKAIKETEARPGQFIALLGAGGGLGHLGIQYAKAMGLRVIALDVGADKQKYCQSLGAELAVDVSKKTHIEEINEYTKGGVHASVTFATNNSAFSDAVSIARRKGFVVFAGLPPGGFNLPIFEVVLKRLTIRGSIVGTKQDAYEALDFAERGLVKSSVVVEDFTKVNDVFDRMRAGKIEGRVVLKISDQMSVDSSAV